MKNFFFTLLLCPLLSTAQKNLPRFENDTLYTSGGYKIYKGQLLQLANGTSAAGYFNFIKFHFNMGRTDTYSLQNSTLLVNKIKGYKYSGPDNNNIRISGIVTYKDGAKAEIDITMNFERVTENYDGQPSELIVPEEFKSRHNLTVKEEMKKQPVTEEIKQQKNTEVVKKQNEITDIKKILVADEIRKLFDLYKAGALTSEEYEAQKKKLLERQ